jgi:type IV secretory pathway VirB10-like protein
MEENTLGREPNPQPAPLPSGAVSKDAKMKALAVVVGGVVFLIIAVWLLWPRQKVSVMGPERGKVTVASFPPVANNISLDMEREKAFEEGKRDTEKKLLPMMNAQNQQALPAYQPVPMQQPIAQEGMVQKASFSDNMVSGRFDLGKTASQPSDRLGSNGSVPPVVGPANGPRVDRPAATIAANALPEGTVIYCALVNQLNGENAGPVKVQVSNDVFFPGTLDVAIPQGSLVLGEANKVGAQFQQRLAVSFHLLQVGNRQIKLDKMPALDQQGAAALQDKVNNHYAQIFGASLAVGAIGGLAQIGQGSYGGLQGYDPSQQVRQGISQSTAQSSSQILSHFLNRMPTLIIRPGTPVVVYLTGNVEIPND